MALDSHLSLGFTTPQDAWSWLVLLSMTAKVGSTVALLGLKAGCDWPWVRRQEQSLWWATKLSALMLCAGATGLCWQAGDRETAVLFAALLSVALLLVAARVRHRLSRRVAATPGP